MQDRDRERPEVGAAAMKRPTTLTRAMTMKRPTTLTRAMTMKRPTTLTPAMTMKRPTTLTRAMTMKSHDGHAGHDHEEPRRSRWP